jgi:hypothetical protein
MPARGACAGHRRGRDLCVIAEAQGDSVASDSTQIRWDAASRIASVRYTAGVSLTGPDGPFLVDALTKWIGVTGEAFAVLADARGLRSTDAAYRAASGNFFKQHRATAYVALTNVGPVIRVVVEMFRLGTGIQLKTFADEGAARGWLRSKGIAA